MQTAATKRTQAAAQTLLEQIQQFIATCRSPCVVEPGEQPIALQPEHYALETRGQACLLHAWSEAGNLVRRITAVERERRGRLDLRARRFGQGETSLALIDRARKGERVARLADQAQYREYLRRVLVREFAPWTLSQLTCSTDLEHSLSGLYSRGFQSRGQQAWAVIGAPPQIGAAGCDQILTFGLIWLDRLRRHQQRRVFRGLRIFLPRGHARTTANRLAFLNRSAFRFELYELDPRGGMTPVEEQNYGNLASKLDPCLPPPEPAEPVAGWLREILANDAVETIAGPDGLLSLRVRGIPFAKAGRGVMTFGLETQRPVGPRQVAEVIALAQQLGRFRSADAPDTLNPLYRQHPESWLESQVRRHLAVVDSTLCPEPVYSQVPAVAGPDRGLIDLLACDRSGRLAVLELKAEEDPHLPLQGLDYWMRAKWHLDRQELPLRGYFPGIELSSLPPRLTLVSPGFQFHPTTETILQYLSPEIEVERVGVGGDWRRELTVVFRKRGAQRLD